ncbi:MAG: flagellar protein FlgN [bacterium]|nr:flagellar protein FlgN [bacterium]
MDDLLLQLRDVIVNENSLYKQLVDLSKEKKDVLLNRDIERLLMIISSEESLISKIQEFEDVRLGIIDNLAEVWQIPKSELNFKKIISLSSVDLSSLYSEFLSTVQELKDLNEMNNQLIRDSLSFINYILNIIVPMQEDFTYGRVKKKKARPLVVDREV